MALLISFIALVGFNFSVWTFVGLLRFYSEQTRYRFKKKSELNIHHARWWILRFYDLFGLEFNFRLTWSQAKEFWRYVGARIFNTGFSPDFLTADSRPPALTAGATLPPAMKNTPVTVEGLAAIIPAHNEEVTIAKTINSLKKVMPLANVYVGSDASTDNTVTIVKALGARVADIWPNKGKAGVLTHLLSHFDLLRRYQAVLIIDADSEVDGNFLENALPLFCDPRVAAVAAHVKSKWTDHWPPRAAMLYSAYRVRLYRIIQAVQRYGQTWKYTNVTAIIPGFSSIYRVSALKRIKIDAPGLIIEDYNMTFEVHHQKLGRVAYTPAAFSYSQDPLSFKDYYKQVKRWNLGFWQTVRRHGYWPGFFWLTIGLFMAEMAFFSLFLLTLPLILITFIVNSFEPLVLPFTVPVVGLTTIRFWDFLIGFFLIDYAITAGVARYEKKPILLWYGLAFLFLRYIDAFLFLYTLPLAFYVKSDGRWVSPKRGAGA